MANKFESLANEEFIKTEKQTKIITYLLLGIQIILIGFGIFSMFNDKEYLGMLGVGCGLGLFIISNSEKLKKIKTERTKRGI